ncbi:MAG: N-acetyltransferase [Chromatiales bacterium]|nr:MAG: N-acetyltransferase [Chromatiales bacterium]
MRTETLTSIDTITAAEWNALAGTDQPFVRHEFLAAMEHTGAVGPGTGWQPCHLVVRDEQDRACGAMPLYSKTDSWGEFVFDFAWADAYRRAGLHYYPKLVAAVPYTPATGPRLLTAGSDDAAAVAAALLAGARRLAAEQQASSLHLLFPPGEELAVLKEHELLLRKDCQFHWHNAGYSDFGEFLGTFTAAKRKKVNRERRRVREAGVRFRVLSGADVNPDMWQQIMPLYAASFWRRGREPYLSGDFFLEIARTLPDHLVIILAEFGGEPIAVALCFRSADTFYGRYWGSSGRYHSLHFETCYYQGIDYCIAHGLQHFEPGTQGEHKISRGFVPTETWSAHWLSHPQFAAAVDDYLERERDHIDDYMAVVRNHVPYRDKHG